jgi:hypothetical protein
MQAKGRGRWELMAIQRGSWETRESEDEETWRQK